MAKRRTQPDTARSNNIISKTLANSEVFGRYTDDATYKAEKSRLALADLVSLVIVQYRSEHQLSQRDLAKMLVMPQSSVARLEAGDHEPSFATLDRLSRTLSIEFHIDFTPNGPQTTSSGSGTAVA